MRPLDPVFIDLTVEYNRYGQPVTVKDSVLMDAASPPVRNYDAYYDYDALRRLKARQEGELSSGSIATQSRIENLARDIGGRITTHQVSLNNDADYTDGPTNALSAGEMNDARTINKRNELRSRSVLDSTNPSTARTVTLAYDKNGNLTDDGEKYTYEYNPWGQLVRIRNRVSPYETQAVYAYNGAGWRISEQLDRNDSGDTGVTDGIVDSYDPVFYLATDLSGRRIATYRGSDTYPKESFIWHPVGIGGPATRGGLILRDRVASLTDPTLWATDPGDSDRGERTYACSDFRGDVVALVSATGGGNGTGALVEQYRYSATGVPIGIPLGDVTGDGDAAGSPATDLQIVDDIYTNSGYEVRGDLNLDGVVEDADLVIAMSAIGTQTGRGKFSAPGVAGSFGYRNALFTPATTELAIIGSPRAWGAMVEPGMPVGDCWIPAGCTPVVPVSPVPSPEFIPPCEPSTRPTLIVPPFHPLLPPDWGVCMSTRWDTADSCLACCIQQYHRALYQAERVYRNRAVVCGDDNVSCWTRVLEQYRIDINDANDAERKCESNYCGHLVPVPHPDFPGPGTKACTGPRCEECCLSFGIDTTKRCDTTLANSLRSCWVSSCKLEAHNAYQACVYNARTAMQTCRRQNCNADPYIPK